MSWDAGGTLQEEVSKDVDLTDFKSSIRHQNPDTQITDKSRSSFVGWLISLGLPDLAVATVIGLGIIALVRGVGVAVRALGA